KVLILLFSHGGIEIIRTFSLFARRGVAIFKIKLTIIQAIRINDWGNCIVEIKIFASKIFFEPFLQPLTSKRSGGHNNIGAGVLLHRLKWIGDNFIAILNQRMGQKSLCDGSTKLISIDGQRIPGGNGMLERKL